MVIQGRDRQLDDLVNKKVHVRFLHHLEQKLFCEGIGILQYISDSHPGIRVNNLGSFKTEIDQRYRDSIDDIKYSVFIYADRILSIDEVKNS
jgi:hypothetical protein